MEKMTPDAIALNRSTSECLIAPPAPPMPLRRDTPAPAERRGPSSEDRRAILTRTVQLQVIPQLLQRPSHSAHSPLASEVERLAELSLQASSREVIDFVTGLLDTGCDAEAIYLDLLTPAAQLLGQYWADDLCTFADVTIGTGHLQTAMRQLRAAFFAARPAQQLRASTRTSRALLLPLPGEQHDFGCGMLSAFFARAGWDVWSGTVRRSTELADMVRRDWIDLVGFSISHDAMLDTAQREIASVRAASCNGALVVMVGGLPFSQNPALAEAVGADGTALDGAQAVEVATALLPVRPSPG